MKLLKCKAGFTLVEMVVVVAVIAVLAAIAVPSVGGYIADSQDTACRTNRREILDHFDLDSGLADSELNVSNLFAYIGANYGGLDEICPAGGTCVIDDSGANLSITCSVHDGAVVNPPTPDPDPDPEPTPDPTPMPVTGGTKKEIQEALLHNAEIILGLYSDFIAELENTYPGISNYILKDGALDFGNASEKIDFGGKKISIGKEFKQLLVDNGFTDEAGFSQGEMHLLGNELGSPDYVYLKKGNVWVKFSLTNPPEVSS